jgi:hypothetical protein
LTNRDQLIEALAVLNEGGIELDFWEKPLDEAARLMLDFPTDEMVEAARLADHDYAKARRQEGEEHPQGKAGFVLEAVRRVMFGSSE